MATRPVDPLQHNVPIVTAEGYPTPQFMRQWMQAREVTLVVGDSELSLDALQLLVDGIGTDVSAADAAINALEAAVTALEDAGSTALRFPFYMADGSLDYIDLVGGEMPFFLADGSPDNIILVV